MLKADIMRAWFEDNFEVENTGPKEIYVHVRDMGAGTLENAGCLSSFDIFSTRAQRESERRIRRSLSICHDVALDTGSALHIYTTDAC